MPFDPFNFAKRQEQQPFSHSNSHIEDSIDRPKTQEIHSSISDNNQITAIDLENVIRQQFADINISKEVINNIVLEYKNLVWVTISLQKSIEKDEKTSFEGWSNSRVKKLVFDRLELTYRHDEHENPVGAKIWYFLKSLIVSDPFDEREKQYIGSELERLIIDHNKINRTANLVSALIGIEAGKVFGGKLIQLLGGSSTQWIQVGIALVVNSGIFWALTVVTENRIRTNYYTKGERKWRWRPTLSLIVITVIKLICVLYAALGGALDFTSVDKRFLTDKYINNYIQEIEAKVENQQREIHLVDQLYERETPEAQKNFIIEELKNIKNPILQMYRKQYEIDKEIKKNRQTLKETPENSNEHIRAYFDGIAGIKEIESNRKAMEAGGASFDSDSSKDSIPALSSNSQDTEKYGLPHNFYYPIQEEERYYIKAIKDLKNPENSPTLFIEKYFIGRYGEAYTKELLNLIKDKKIEDLPIGDKAHILQAKLKNEFANKLIPSLFASAFVPLFLEIMSLLTLFAVFNAPRYKMLYSNRDFQDKIESLSSTLINYMQVRYQQIVEEKSTPEDKVNRPLVYEEFWQQVILQRIREGKSPSIEGLVSEYTQQFYKLDKFKQSKLND